MRCPYCASENTRVMDSRLGDGGECVRRRRKCAGCGQRFTTFERMELKMPLVAKSDQRREKFSEEKLRLGISRALEKRPVNAEAVEGAVSRVMRRFTHQGEREIPSREIGEAVMLELGELDEVAYVRFASVYRRFQDIDAFSDEVDKLRGMLASLPNKAQQSLFAGGKKPADDVE